MKILVTGVKGQLGYDVCRVLFARQMEYRGVDIEDFDITDRTATERFIADYHPDAIIHCSAYTAVDRAEDDAERCMAVNADGTANVAYAAASIGAKVMYISTDYVFPGKGKCAYKTTSPTKPLSVYGTSKLAGEEAVRAATANHFIVRISWAFGKNGNNFVKTMLRLAETKSDLNVVCDQIGSPTYTLDLARLLCDMIVTDRFGTYHATNEGYCSWAEFAEAIMQLSNKTTRIHPIPSSEYPSRAARPLNSRMNKDELDKNGFERLPHWKDALSRFLKEQNETEG